MWFIMLHSFCVVGNLFFNLRAEAVQEIHGPPYVLLFEETNEILEESWCSQRCQGLGSNSTHVPSRDISLVKVRGFNYHSLVERIFGQVEAEVVRNGRNKIH